MFLFPTLRNKFITHAPLTITISIIKENILTKKHMIVKDRKKEKIFVNEIIKVIKDIDMSNLSDIISLGSVVCSYTWSLDYMGKNSKIINITKHSKSWWDANCSKNLQKYKSSKSIGDWKQFKKIVMFTKCFFFDLKI